MYNTVITHFLAGGGGAHAPLICPPLICQCLQRQTHVHFELTSSIGGKHGYVCDMCVFIVFVWTGAHANCQDTNFKKALQNYEIWLKLLNIKRKIRLVQVQGVSYFVACSKSTDSVGGGGRIIFQDFHQHSSEGI